MSGDNDYAARITRSERNSQQLERNFQEVGRGTRLCEDIEKRFFTLSPNDLQTLLDLWADKQTRQDVREELKSNDIHVAAFRHDYQLDAADDVDILGKVRFDLPQVPMRHDRVTRFWERDEAWLRSLAGNDAPEQRVAFWETALDHYALYSINDLERGETYNAPQFVHRFGSFAHFLPIYGGGHKLRADLDQVKRHLYVAN